MMIREVTRTNRLFRLGLLTAALALSVGLFTPLLAERESRAPDPQLLSWHGYFPLNTGNRWVYEVQGPGGSSRNWEVKVKGEKSGGPFRTHFELSGYFGNEARLVRNTVLGSVLERGVDGKDYLWYEFSGRVGRTWTMQLAPLDVPADVPACQDGAQLKIGARDEKMTVPAGEFKQVIRIDFMTKCADAGITHEWFAPGVGLIRREETSIAGPVVSELVYAEVGGKVMPSSAYSTALVLSRSLYWNNLMPPVDLTKLPRVHGSFVIRDRTSEPFELVFPSSCIGLQIEVRNQAGAIVISDNTLKNQVCLAVVTRVDLGKEALVVPFSFKLADKDGKPLPNGIYSITAILLTQGTEQPAAKALIEVKSAE